MVHAAQRVPACRQPDAVGGVESRARELGERFCQVGFWLRHAEGAARCGVDAAAAQGDLRPAAVADAEDDGEGDKVGHWEVC